MSELKHFKIILFAFACGSILASWIVLMISFTVLVFFNDYVCFTEPILGIKVTEFVLCLIGLPVILYILYNAYNKIIES